MVMMGPDDWRYLAGLSDGYVLEKLLAAERKVGFDELGRLRKQHREGPQPRKAEQRQTSAERQSQGSDEWISC
eukprot:SAG22_NODE_136_length_18095_cov_19.897255_29_plen_73_part_00